MCVYHRLGSGTLPNYVGNYDGDVESVTTDGVNLRGEGETAQTVDGD